MVCAATDLQRQAAHNGINYGQWLRHFIKGSCINGAHKYQDSAHDLCVNLSPCVATVTALAGEMTGICDT